MEQEFVQERISRGKKAMENVQADYEDAKEALKWKQSNLGFLLTDETFRYLQNEVESCRKTYDTWVETYRELINSSSVRLST